MSSLASRVVRRLVAASDEEVGSFLVRASSLKIFRFLRDAREIWFVTAYVLFGTGVIVGALARNWWVTRKL